MPHTREEVPEEKVVDKTMSRLAQQKQTLRAFPFWRGALEREETVFMRKHIDTFLGSLSQWLLMRTLIIGLAFKNETQ